MTREEEIYAEALLLSGDARREYLERACGGDSALRENVEALLSAYASSENFLSGSLAAKVFAGIEPQPGDRIGQYAILRKIGEGGCGLVFLAEQEHPLRRRVALKIVKPGMDSRQVIARFEAERQALAQMEHPDIARVFDAGSTPAGRPFFAMEYVEGVPITRYCDEAALPLGERLELFARVCLALQHAHQKGIIHRDVKPSNILVTLTDGLPAPKIIDFGIAKATQAGSADATLLTGFEQFLGTPAYMSPEQAERRDLDIDTRSDIYSLGVLLYELLAGQPPFDPKSLVQAGVEEIRRIIREVDPPRPSTALSTLGIPERTLVARRRAAAPERLTSVLRGDLDWIVMRCMEKDRARRYGTANELAEDIRRHLRSETIAARPPTAAYRARKFARRHKVACTAALAVALSLMLGTLVSLEQAMRANRAEENARRRQAEAEDLLAFMLGDFRPELKKIGRLELLDRVGDKATAYFASLDPRDLTEPALARYAKALTQIGEIRLDQARYADAAARFDEAHSRAAALVARHPRNPDYLFERAQTEYWIGSVARRRGDFPTARQWFVRYRTSALALVSLEGSTERANQEAAYAYHNLAVLDLDTDTLAAARAGFLLERGILRELQSRAPDALQLADRLGDNALALGVISEREGNYAEALRSLDEGARLYEALAKKEPANARWRLRSFDSLAFSADVSAIHGRRAEALQRYEQALPIIERLASDDPANLRWQQALLNARLCQGALFLAEGDRSAAGKRIASSLARLEALERREPQARLFTATLAKAWRLETCMRLETKSPDAATAAARAVALGALLVKEGRADYRALGEYAQARVLAGRLARSSGREDQAREHFLRALEVLTEKLPTSDDWHFLDPAARALTALGRTDEAHSLFQRLKQVGYEPLSPFAESYAAPATDK